MVKLASNNGEINRATTKKALDWSVEITPCGRASTWMDVLIFSLLSAPVTH